MARIELTEADHGSTAAAKPGDDLVIELPEIPTSGHRWAVEELSGGLQGPVQDEFEPGGGAIGAGGRRRLTFAVRDPGDARISLVRRQEWEPEQPSGQFQASLRVAPSG